MQRKSICLNGEWDFMPIYGVESCLELPQKLVFEKEKIRVPSIWRDRVVSKSPAAQPFGQVDDFQPFNMFEYPQKMERNPNRRVPQEFFCSR